VLTASLIASGIFTASGQGFIYDQQSADNNPPGGLTAVIQSNQPIGQSFTPTLSSVGFISLWVGDTSLNALGATVFVDLHADSITGTVIGSTQPVSMPDGYTGFTDFLFTTPVALTPGASYVLQPIVQSGDQWVIVGYNYNYPGGTAIIRGVENPMSDVWFREGIIVPEPSVLSLILIGSGEHETGCAEHAALLLTRLDSRA